MNIVSLTVKNWMNFQELENVPLHARNYVIGAKPHCWRLAGRYQPSWWTPGAALSARQEGQ